MAWYETLTEAARSGLPGFAGSTVFAIASKPKSIWQTAGIIACGLAFSQVFTKPLVNHLDLDTFVGPIGFLLGFGGMTFALLGVILSQMAQELGPNVVKEWIKSKTGGDKDGSA